MSETTKPVATVETDSVTITDAHGSSVTLRGEHMAALTDKERRNFADAWVEDLMEDADYAAGKAVDQMLIEDMLGSEK